MDTAKIYYAVIVLLMAVSVLLSPFFYIRRGKRVRKTAPSTLKYRVVVVVSNVVLLAVMIFALGYFLRKN